MDPDWIAGAGCVAAIVAALALHFLGAPKVYQQAFFYGSLPAAIVISVVFRVVRFFWRRAALAEAAIKLGLSYARAVPYGVLVKVGAFNVFDFARKLKGRNLMEGQSGGAPVAVLDCRCTTGSGRGSSTTWQTTAIYQRVKDLPEFFLSPATYPFGVGRPSRRKDAIPDPHAEFFRHYRLGGADDAAMDATFDQATLQYFAEHRGWSVRSLAGSLGVYRENRLCGTSKIAEFLDQAASIRRTLLKN